MSRLLRPLVNVKSSKQLATYKHDIAADPNENNAMAIKELPSCNDSLSSMVKDLTIVDSNDNKLSLEWRESVMPPVKEFFEGRVTYMENDGPIWVVDVANTESLERLTNNIARSMQHQKSCSIEDVSIGSLVGVAVDHKMYRGEVIDVNVSAECAEVRLIDYGAVVACDLQDIYLPVQRMARYKAYAFRVKLPTNTGVQINKNLTLRLLGSKTIDGIEQVQLKTKMAIPFNLPVELLIMKPEVSVVRILQQNVSLGEPQVALLQINAMKNLNDELNTILSEKSGQQFTEPFREDTRTFFLAARTKHGYRRALLLDFIKQPMLFLVYEMDEGCISLTSEVCRIPNEFLGYPLSVFAVTREEDKTSSLKEQLRQCGPDLSIKFNMDNLAGKDKDKLRTVKAALFANNKQVCAVRVNSFLGLVNQLGHKYWREPIDNNNLVYISHVVNYQEVYISSVQSKQYEDIFKRLEVKCPPLDREILTGDVVLVVSSSRANYRAEITAVENNKFSVRNIDTGSTHHVAGTYLRRPCRFIENLPVSQCRVKIKTICNIPSTAVPPNTAALQILKRLYEHKSELQVKFDDSDSNTVDLLDFTAEPYSLMTRMLPVLFTPVAIELKPAEDLPELTAVNPKPIKPSHDQYTPVTALPPLPPSPPNSPREHQKTSNQVQRHYFNDLKRHLLPLGENMQVLVLHANGLHKTGYVTACFFSSEKEAEEFQDLLNLVAEIGSSDDQLQPGYLPEVGEMCLALFVEDNSWYRGVCKRITGQKALILYCDFGNLEMVSVERIKPITTEVLHGVYATTCFIDGFNKGNNFLNLEHYLSNKNKIICDVLDGPEPNTRVIKIPLLDKILSKELI
ncbi:uncharacterized protein LOC111602786 isoform X2 [Drosophila hydei]|uniref:Uncharacterized protein LOC111602786 isoform X2 n=1 Tax=Drosophila hydei TaxID=7224 RepID=A0A6J1MFL1_DROHY|nr:uncharacterized protein LOC111602786 isoform X2 [Drosophila hydei]